MTDIFQAASDGDIEAVRRALDIAVEYEYEDVARIVRGAAGDIGNE